MQTSLPIKTTQSKQVVDITRRVSDLVHSSGITEGLCSVFVTHTTAALTTVVLDPGTDLDFLDAYTAMVPDLNYRHPHNPAHAPDHIIASLIGPSVTVPIKNGGLILGTWQHIVLFEFDGPRQRNVIVTLLAGSD